MLNRHAQRRRDRPEQTRGDDIAVGSAHRCRPKRKRRGCNGIHASGGMVALHEQRRRQEGSAWQQHVIDHLDHAVRLMHIRNADIGNITLGVFYDDVGRAIHHQP
jgi:hypothetical protein